ncbi:hypothetical protein BD560DRAFT_409211 [Blakeslea trispora]|nr:hypothetical protein BD560DRAFT_409211 [Blakeslea trispora]
MKHLKRTSFREFFFHINRLSSTNLYLFQPLFLSSISLPPILSLTLSSFFFLLCLQYALYLGSFTCQTYLLFKWNFSSFYRVENKNC